VIEIRKEKPEDSAAIREVHEQAFGRPDEAHLVTKLREANKPPISLVAVYDERVVGHVMFSPVTIAPAQAGFNADEHFMAIVRERALAEAGSVVKYQPEFEEAAC